MLEVRNFERQKDRMRLFEVIVWSGRDFDVELWGGAVGGDRGVEFGKVLMDYGVCAIFMMSKCELHELFARTELCRN